MAINPTAAINPTTAEAERWSPDVRVPDVTHLVTEDDTPVDNLFSERQMRLLAGSLYGGWQPTVDGRPRPYFAAANVGLFATDRDPPLVPDVLLSMDVTGPKSPLAKAQRSYFVWEFGKFPDVVIEIVSNREGGELKEKRWKYAHLRIPYYIVYDPVLHLSDQPLYVLRLAGDLYVPHRDDLLGGTGLGVRLWDGTFEGMDGRWLRFVDDMGALLLTGAERADAESERADAESERADAESERADAESERADAESERADAESERARAERERAEAQREQADAARQVAQTERERAERLAARLRELGLDPDSV